MWATITKWLPKIGARFFMGSFMTFIVTTCAFSHYRTTQISKIMLITEWTLAFFITPVRFCD